VHVSFGSFLAPRKERRNSISALNFWYFSFKRKVQEPHFATPVRKGFVVVEWGGKLN